MRQLTKPDSRISYLDFQHPTLSCPNSLPIALTMITSNHSYHIQDPQTNFCQVNYDLLLNILEGPDLGSTIITGKQCQMDLGDLTSTTTTPTAGISTLTLTSLALTLTPILILSLSTTLQENVETSTRHIEDNLPYEENNIIIDDLSFSYADDNIILDLNYAIFNPLASLSFYSSLVILISSVIFPRIILFLSIALACHIMPFDSTMVS